MATYWVSFHIHKDDTYSDRYDALYEAIAKVAIGEWWIETTSFIVFESNYGIDAIKSEIVDAVSARFDTVLLSNVNVKDMRLIGLQRDLRTLQALVPFVK